MAVEKKKPEAPLSDKKKALETAISQIEKNFGKGTVMRLGDRPEMNVEAIPTGSLALDAALGIGGVPKGRIIEIYGPESSGKTTLALHIVAQAQKRGGEVAFVDAEHALDPDYAASNRCGHRLHARLPAGYRRAGAGDYRRARALGCGGRGGCRLGRGARRRARKLRARWATPSSAFRRG